ncbi:DUF3883 domain-containing protein [Pseudomonas gingeri]|uniref:DUF3883 domain-containing protein n=1 Tax=Pseudomonas gingeri TaxID=117681 RepID=UPI0015A0FF03|nr:DUF3883 domain-containing protein [Pseudomonas gingeri]NWA26543.1 DUF3883 domain-containing protein [Pseudomonas gingeri]
MSLLSRLQSPSAVQSALNEFSNLGQASFLKRYGFGKSKSYRVRNPLNREECDIKAIVAVAYGVQFPADGQLTAADIPESEKALAAKLEPLGFETVRIGESWSQAEVDATVADYFEMLRLEAEQRSFNKTEHNKALRAQLNGRSKGSVELKHANISSILNGLDLPFIDGYKPRGNSQLLLRQAVQTYVTNNQGIMLKIVDAFEDVKAPGQKTYKGVVVDAPEKETLLKTANGGPRIRVPRKLNYAARDEANRTLGRCGEEWVIGYEHHRLQEAGYAELIQKLEWISETQGDGAGFDILSFDSPSQHRYIEVKTTNNGISAPFIISHNELQFSKEMEQQFSLYRVFDLRNAPKLFILRGDLTDRLHLKPLDFRASFRDYVS